ncbi:Cullin repeat-like-containing domain protein [Syncephalis fuscata]|nr:Cullin repeat-like-containing domain protein [Syncephalis fuscata]
MLDRLNDRLGMLESSILPIHESTQAMSRLEEDQKQQALSLKTVIEYMDMASEEEAIIIRGPSDGDLDKYLLAIAKVKQACEVLNHSKFHCCERVLAHMTQVMKASLHHLKDLFRKRLQSCSHASAQADGDYSVPASSLDSLASLGTYMSSAETEFQYVTDYTKIYSEVRSAYLKKAFTMLAQSAGMGDAKAGGVYQKGSSPFIGFTEGLIRMLKAERKILARVVLHADLDPIFDDTIGPVTDMYVATGDTIIRNAQRSLHNNVFMLFDILDTLESSSASFNKCFNGTSKQPKVAELQKAARASVITFFPEFLEGVRAAGNRPTPLAEDGTVHEFTSETLNSLKRLLEFGDRVEQMLTTLGSGNWNLQTKTHTKNAANVGIVGSYVLDVIDTLVTALETLSRSYGKRTLGAIFLMNNYHYVYKMIESSFQEWIGPTELQKYEQLVKQQREVYQASWKPVIGILMDVTYIKGGEVKRSLSSSEKAQIKEKFKYFNDAFDLIYRDQRGYSIPDPDLRQEIIQEIGQVLIPMYSRFADKYKTSDFTKNAAKYVKYSPENLQAMLKSFFENAA